MVQAAKLLGIVLIIQSCYTGESQSTINVKIEAVHDIPSTFDREPPYYRAGTPLTLICNSNVVGRAFYHWTSDCSMNSCFTKDKLNKNVSTEFLRSIDSGEHTCTVKGTGEERGSDSITVRVVGAGIYDSVHKAALSNNSLILAEGNLDFICVSGSEDSNIGYVLDINGTNINSSHLDPFFTFQRTTGAIHVRTTDDMSFGESDKGIYTCRIPDERGIDQDVHVGLYPGGPGDVELDITKIARKAEKPGLYTVNCTSTHSPATHVTWTRNGVRLGTSDSGGMYTSYQEVDDRENSTYRNVLTISGADASGDYRCDIENLYKKTYATLSVEKLEVTGYNPPLIVGVEYIINCTSFVNSTLMTWSKKDANNGGVSDKSTFLELRLQPTLKLNNTAFICRAYIPSGQVETDVTIYVREPINIVKITGPDDPWRTDNDKPYTLTCHVSHEFNTDVKWLDPEGMEVMEDDVYDLERAVSGNNTTLNLTFNGFNTSHAGEYTCVSKTIDPKLNPASENSSHWNVTIKLPSPIVTVVSVPDDAPHYTGFQFDLLCYSEIDEAVDTDVIVNHIWTRASRSHYPFREFQTDSHVTALPVSGENRYSFLQFSPLHKRDDYFYSCNSTVYPSPGSYKHEYLVKSNSTSATDPFDLSPILKTEIEIIYTAPDLFPDYTHPNYRAASSVTLNCTAEGGEGTVSYRWSSNCSSCFVSGSRSSTVTRDFLRTRDMGNHTCTATDSARPMRTSGSDSTHINIVGAGIYVEWAQYYFGTQRAQPKNTHINVYSDPRSNGTNSLRFRLWCCSNATENYVGSVTDPNGITHTRHFKDLRVYRHHQSSSYGGCIRLEGYRHYFYPLNYDSGVYSCNIPDASGENHIVHFGLYNNGTQHVPSIYRFDHRVDDPTSVLTLRCETRTAPPTNITWLKNGVKIADDDVLRKTQILTDRVSSTYVSTISMYDTLAGHIATYTVIVNNSHANDSKIVKKNHTVEGIKITPSEGQIVNNVYMGDLSRMVTFDCSSDLFPSRIEWYNDSGLLNKTDGSSGHAEIRIVSTDHHEAEYRCKAVSSMEYQEIKFKINVKVPVDDWATVEITDVTNREPLHDNDHILMCNVTLDRGLNIVPEVHWYHPDGSPVDTDGRVREGPLLHERLSSGHKRFIRKLYFLPVLHDDGGEYTCNAEVDVSWMATQPVNETYDVVVTTQANMQLRIEALPHCSTWEPHRTYYLEKAILKNIEKVVQKECNCDFDSSEIHSGEFSCRTKRELVTYRAIINGSSDPALLSANETLDIIDEWKTTEATMRYHKFRLQLSPDCPVSFKSFNELECLDDGEKRGCDNRKGDMLFNSSTCYTFKSCDDDSDIDEGST